MLLLRSKSYVLTVLSSDGSGGRANETGDGERCGGGVVGDRCVSRLVDSWTMRDEYMAERLTGCGVMLGTEEVVE